MHTNLKNINVVIRTFRKQSPYPYTSAHLADSTSEAVPALHAEVHGVRRPRAQAREGPKPKYTIPEPYSPESISKRRPFYSLQLPHVATRAAEKP